MAWHTAVMDWRTHRDTSGRLGMRTPQPAKVSPPSRHASPSPPPKNSSSAAEARECARTKAIATLSRPRRSSVQPHDSTPRVYRKWNSCSSRTSRTRRSARSVFRERAPLVSWASCVPTPEPTRTSSAMIPPHPMNTSSMSKQFQAPKYLARRIASLTTNSTVKKALKTTSVTSQPPFTLSCPSVAIASIFTKMELAITTNMTTA
mmetsp:Transcript_110181/g.298847  ORF Transcript_110181/g.298847 Transcript_110181/m.298847 type:complete len:205 (-) Transcript_110181:23-637(-)